MLSLKSTLASGVKGTLARNKGACPCLCRHGAPRPEKPTPGSICGVDPPFGGLLGGWVHNKKARQIYSNTKHALSNAARHGGGVSGPIPRGCRCPFKSVAAVLENGPRFCPHLLHRGFDQICAMWVPSYFLFGGLGGDLALTGGSGGISGDRRTRIGHTYPLPGSMAPQGALRPKLTRLSHPGIGKSGP